MQKAHVVRWVAALASIAFMPIVNAQNPDLSAERQYWEDLAAIEKARSEVETAQAERRKAIADADKAAKEARFPPGTTNSLSGAIDRKETMGLAANVVAVELAVKVAESVCAKLGTTEPAIVSVVLYQKEIFDAIANSRLLLDQLTWLEKDLKTASDAAKERERATPAQPPPPVSDRMRRRLFATTGLVALTGSIRAFADLTSLFKTNVSVESGAFATGDAQLILATAMQKSCPKQFTTVDGYIGDLPSDAVSDARKRISTMHMHRDAIAKEKDLLTAELAKRPENERTEARSEIDDLTTLIAQTDAFLAALKPFDSGDASPLTLALKYRALADRISKHDVMELKFLLEGLSVTRDNMFTGQKLYLSATSVLWYRVTNREGMVKLADVQRRIVTPMFLDVKGKNPQDGFFTSLDAIDGQSRPD